MSNYNLHTPNTSKATVYKLNAVDLYTNLNSESQYIQLRNSVTNIVIKESLFTNGITADIGISDGQSILEAFKLGGNEKIILHISRSEVTGETKEYKITLYVAEINNYSRTRIGVQNYNLKCVSEYLYANQLITLTRSFEGSYGNIIKDICKTNLKISNKKLDISTSTGVAKGIFPRIKPLSAIQWLLQNCADDGTPFFFYETIQGKVKLKSYKELLDQGVYAKYNNHPFTKKSLAKTDKAFDAFNEELRKIRSLSSDLNISKYKSASEGVFGSQSLNIDIATKTKPTVEYTFIDEEKKKLNPFKSFSNNLKFLDRPITDHKKGKNYFISKNSLAYGDNLKNYHNDFGQNNLESSSRLYNLNALTKDITVAGDFDLELGSIIDLYIIRAGAQGKEIPKDLYLSGNYLVTGKIHTFTKEGYFIKLKIKKDSFIESADDILKITRNNNES